MAESRKDLALVKHEVLAVLKRKNKIKYVCQDLTLIELKNVISRLQELYDERAEEESKNAELRNEQSRLTMGKLSELLDEGIELDFIEQMIAEKKDNSTNDESQTIYEKDGVGWSGRGRRPKVFQGLSPAELEQFRIKHK